MQRANIHDRTSIERIYPRAVFESEAKANSRAKASVLNGVAIASGVDAAGNFELTRASQHVGEETVQGTAIFLCPFAQEAAAAGHNADYPAAAPASGGGKEQGPYDRFIDRILMTARAAEFGSSPGPGDARLQGLRQ